jgi:SAM-dependent methyltransferase
VQQQSTALGRFECNVCGAQNESDGDVADRERATCGSCGSSMRYRSVILVLSRVLFGKELRLDEFPRLKSVRGVGISDSDVYADRLADRFHYTNTYYHREPRLDLSRPDRTEFGQFDFIICSEVLEHVPPPVDGAFRTLASLLKESGVLILTVPYSLESKTVEHFPNLHEATLADINGRTVLVNHSGNGGYEVFDDLVFHGGAGSTLEMRLFSEADLRARLATAGFANVRIEGSGSRRFGVVYDSPCSLPIVASKTGFSLGPGGIGELTEQLVEAGRLLNAVRESRWLRMGQWFGLGPRIPRSK